MTAFHDFNPDRQNKMRLYCQCGEKKSAACHGPRPLCDRCEVGDHGCTGVGCYCLCMKKHSQGTSSLWKHQYEEQVGPVRWADR